MADKIAVLDEEKCGNCGICIVECEQECFSPAGVGQHFISFNAVSCTGCGDCVKECRDEALTLKQK